MLAEAPDLAQGVSALLRAICENLDWPYGAFWTVDASSGSLQCHEVCTSRGDLRDLVQACRDASVAKGEGVPGRVWAQGEMVVLRDIRGLERSPRSAAAVRAGLHSILAAPVWLDRELFGVLEFSMRKSDIANEPPLQMLSSIATQLGLFVERTRAEEQLRKASANLQRSNTDLQQFAYVASHDLFEPLRMVTSYLQLLAQMYGANLDNPAQEFIGYALDGARRMDALIRDLLAYSRVDNQGRPFEPTSCEQVLRAATANLKVAIAETGAEIRHGPLPEVQGDRIQLTQVFQNLLANAIKFHGTHPPRIEVGAHRLDGRWQFHFRDNGIGIDPKFFERIFVIFQRLHRDGPGDLQKNHRASRWPNLAPICAGPGFDILLHFARGGRGEVMAPLASGQPTGMLHRESCSRWYMETDTIIEEAQSEMGTRQQPDVATELKHIRVLLVEDNPGDARLIQLMLAEAGGELFEVESVGRLSAGLERLQGRNGTGLVLLDLSLPDSQGLETFLQIHARVPNIPIIVLSGLNDTRVAVQAVHEGAQDFLVKGRVDGQLLVRAMHYALERKAMTEQLSRYAEELRSRNAQLQADFNMAREIQEIFLPQQYPTFPKWVGPENSALHFSHRYLPAAAVGGDFFDVFAITSTTAGVFICDVMGHGMRAALVTAIMRGLVEELMPGAADPGKFLQEINRSLHAILRRTREPFLATAFYLVADVANSEMRFASAGHPSPLRLRRDAGTAECLKCWDARHGPALGLFDKPNYPACRAPLRPHDLLLLFTDGIYEVDNTEQGEFGLERLVQSARRNSRLGTEELLDAVLRDVQRFAGTREFPDDVCLVAMDVRKVNVEPEP